MPFVDALDSVSFETLVLVCGSQMGKTDAVLDMIGWRLDTRPRPQLYVGPSKEFLTDQLEPRIMALLDQAPSLSDKVARGKRMKKTRKVVAGVPLRLAWAGSPTQLSSDQAGDIHVDELDRMGADVGNEGDPLTMVRARGFTYKDRKIVVTSTPKKGALDIEADEATGLVFWKPSDPRDLESPIWKLFQGGTRHHWAWPCPQCGEYFIPRFSCLKWPEKATAAEAKLSAHLLCPRDACGGVILEEHKAGMNAAGVYVAPGQGVTADGDVYGDPPNALALSCWVSGLASPFVTFGERAAAWIEALASGDQEQVQGVINTGFGELYAPGGGEAPEWMELSAKRRVATYARGEVPEGVLALTLTADVQKGGIWWTVRGWGARASSWLIDHGRLIGDTIEPDIWTDLADLVTTPIGGLPIKLTFIDSGFRPGKVESLPLNRVYEFCRRFPRIIRPTKGSSTAMRRPIVESKIEVAKPGRTSKYDLQLVRLDTDHWKSWVHERLRWPEDQPGAWHLPTDADDDYCKQLVSEARMRLPSGRVRWEQRSRDNHYLDCEAMQAAAGAMLNVQRIGAERGVRRPAPQVAPPIAKETSSDAEPRPRGGNWLPQKGGNWLGNRSDKPWLR